MDASASTQGWRPGWRWGSPLSGRAHTRSHPPPSPSPEFSLRGDGGGRGPGTRKSKSLCTKNSQIHISHYEICPPPPGDGEFLSTTLPPCVTFRRVVAPLWGPGQSPVLPRSVVIAVRARLRTLAHIGAARLRTLAPDSFARLRTVALLVLVFLFKGTVCLPRSPGHFRANICTLAPHQAEHQSLQILQRIHQQTAMSREYVHVSRVIRSKKSQRL